MAVDIFLKLDPIKGESLDDKHKDEIDILSWSFGESQSGTFHSGSGGGAGKVSVQDLHFTHFVDKATPELFKVCANGKHIDTAILPTRPRPRKPRSHSRPPKSRWRKWKAIPAITRPSSSCARTTSWKG